MLSDSLGIGQRQHAATLIVNRAARQLHQLVQQIALEVREAIDDLPPNERNLQAAFSGVCEQIEHLRAEAEAAVDESPVVIAESVALTGAEPIIASSTESFLAWLQTDEGRAWQASPAAKEVMRNSATLMEAVL